jgi:hypothetical protein
MLKKIVGEFQVFNCLLDDNYMKRILCFLTNKHNLMNHIFKFYKSKDYLRIYDNE